jgi:GLPGLI family protein
VSYSQNLKIEYQAEFTGFKIDSTKNLSAQQERMLVQLESRIKNSVKNRNITVYTLSDDRFYLVSLDPMAIEGQFKSSLGESILQIHAHMYGIENEVYGYNDGDDFIVKYINNDVKWQLVNESKDILGFKSFKAIPLYSQSFKKGKDYPTEVWYAPSINHEGGPFVYSNLPGLILEVSSNSMTISVSNIVAIDYDKSVPIIDKEIISELEAFKKAKATGAAIEARMKN